MNNAERACEASKSFPKMATRQPEPENTTTTQAYDFRWINTREAFHAMFLSTKRMFFESERKIDREWEFGRQKLFFLRLAWKILLSDWKTFRTLTPTKSVLVETPWSSDRFSPRRWKLLKWKFCATISTLVQLALTLSLIINVTSSFRRTRALVLKCWGAWSMA